MYRLAHTSDLTSGWPIVTEGTSGDGLQKTLDTLEFDSKNELSSRSNNELTRMSAKLEAYVVYLKTMKGGKITDPQLTTQLQAENSGFQHIKNKDEATKPEVIWNNVIRLATSVVGQKEAKELAPFQDKSNGNQDGYFGFSMTGGMLIPEPYLVAGKLPQTLIHG